jgi:hypothetical protein
MQRWTTSSSSPATSGTRHLRTNRIRQGRPCLTINQLPQFVAQVVGDIRINRPSIKVRPAEDGDEDVAEVRQGLIRAIEQQNRAQNIYAAGGADADRLRHRQLPAWH